MKKLLIPALGAATAMLGAPQAVADGILLSQLMIIGQPGQTGSANRTLPSGSAGAAPSNIPAPSPFATPSVPGAIQPTPFIGQRGELNYPEPEMVGPAERDERGRLLPSVDRTRARFAGERGPDGKLLPTYTPDQRAQAEPAQQTQPPTPPASELKREQQPAQPGPTPSAPPRRPSASETSRSTQPSGQPSAGGGAGSEINETAALNALSAEGYVPLGKIERVGNAWQTTATKNGRQVTVQVDPRTRRVTER